MIQHNLHDTEAYITSCKTLFDELYFQYFNAITEQSGKRLLRKLERKCRLLESYIQIQEAAEKVLSLYHRRPAYIVNRFWSLQDYVQVIRAGAYPSVEDFFNWYVHTDTLALEKAEAWI